MIVVTGGAGFIGSAMVWKLNEHGVRDVLIVDELGTDDKWKNLVGLRYADFLHKDAFIAKVRGNTLAGVTGIIHLGACSATTERDADFLMENNFRYTRDVCEWAANRGIRTIYASSAATYGDGEGGFSDDEKRIPDLRPLNMYGYSKQLFDVHALRTGLAAQLVGVKFFNVFGANEYHKGKMRSVPLTAFEQIRDTGALNLFKSYRPDYADGEQKRDFVYVKDCVNMMWWLLNNKSVNGVFNLGTGTARTWNDLGRAVFAAMSLPADIRYIEMPDGLRNQYQYFTEAPMSKLLATGCPAPAYTLETAVADYVQTYLAPGMRCL
ncbi:MAG: ADP-glyceromanno-heptose 6-epimerase [Armatimonadetes bacterium]|nr:ADP-glyceromanno-heptose 6-epimerase [Armatimonadota bacterium]